MQGELPKTLILDERLDRIEDENGHIIADVFWNVPVGAAIVERYNIHSLLREIAQQAQREYQISSAMHELLEKLAQITGE